MSNTTEDKISKLNLKTQENFNAVMDSLFNLAEEFHEFPHEELSENEITFLSAFDEYVESCCELDELEDSNNN